MSTMPPPGQGGPQDPDQPPQPPQGPPPQGPPPQGPPPQGPPPQGPPPGGGYPGGGYPGQYPGGQQDPGAQYGPQYGQQHPGGGQYPGPPYGEQYPGGPPYGSSPYGRTPELGASWRRLLARIIDSILVGICGWVLSLPFAGTDPDGWNGSDQYAVSAITVGFYFLYDGFQNTMYGRTLGKRALDLRIVRVQDGGELDAAAGWSRSAVYTLPPLVPCAGTLFWLVDILWHLWDRPWRQCLHDKVARTTVIRNRGRR